jgi:glutamate/tyrosine decarboxylase-like PLP-dependent enzyme
VTVLESRIEEDRANGDLPFLVVGTAGSTAIGAIDDLPVLAEICRRQNLWLHVDAAYGGFAACLPDASVELRGLSEADSVAIDPHKWLYSPLEAGCVLVKNPQTMVDTFSYTPTYYKFREMTEGAPINYYEFGPQNSRGFRAFKVWLALRQVGAEGYVRMISEDIRLSKYLHQLADQNPEFEAHRQSLSITTFRYAPSNLELQDEEREAYLNQLNTEILADLQKGGEAFLSNAVVNDKFLLRSCIVNFRTSQEDIEAVPEIILRLGMKIDERMRSKFNR